MFGEGLFHGKLHPMPVLTLQNFLRGSSRQFLEMFPVTSQLSKVLIGGFGLCVIRQRCAANTKSEGNVGFENNDSFGELSCLSTLNYLWSSPKLAYIPPKMKEGVARPELAVTARTAVTCKCHERMGLARTKHAYSPAASDL
jgi:hypothetical protein